MNNQKTLVDGIKKFFEEIGEWDPAYLLKATYSSPGFNITWNQLLKVTGNILKERHPIINYIIFKRISRYKIDTFFILKDDTLLKTSIYKTLVDLKFDGNKSIIYYIMNELYLNYSIKYDINEPLYLEY